MKFNNELYERALERYTLTKDGRLLTPDGKKRKHTKTKTDIYSFLSSLITEHLKLSCTG